MACTGFENRINTTRLFACELWDDSLHSQHWDDPGCKLRSSDLVQPATNAWLRCAARPGSACLLGGTAWRSSVGTTAACQRSTVAAQTKAVAAACRATAQCDAAAASTIGGSAARLCSVARRGGADVAWSDGSGTVTHGAATTYSLRAIGRWFVAVVGLFLPDAYLDYE